MHYKSVQPVSNLEELVYQALEDVVRSHPILFAVPLGLDTTEPYWGRLPSIDITRAVRFVERTTPLPSLNDGRDNELDSLLQAEHNTSFKDGYGTCPVWRVVIVRGRDVQNEFTACLVAHHSMSDGTGLQVFQNNFQAALDKIASSSPPIQPKADHIVYSDANDPIAPSLEDVHPLPLPTEPPEANISGIKDWTGTPVEVPCSTRYASLSLSPRCAQRFAEICKQNRSASTAAIPAVISSLLFGSLPSTAEALLLNLPVSLRTDLPPKVVEGAMGNYIDAFKVKLLRSDLARESATESPAGCLDIWAHAKKVAQATRKYFANASPTGQPYTNIAWFKMIPDLGAALKGLPGGPRGESFEVSNLGTFAQSKGAETWKAGTVTLSRCAYAAGAPLVVCVISSDANLGFGFTWQDGAIGDHVVENVLGGVRTYFESLA